VRWRASGPCLSLALCLALCLALAGCSGGDESAEDSGTPPGDWKTVTATDDSGSLRVPAGWTAQRGWLERPVVIAEHGADPAGTVRVSTYLDPLQAERAAIQAGEILGNQGVLCDRIDGSEVFGRPRLVFDCPREVPGKPTQRTVLVPLSHDAGSALVLVQVDADSLEDTADLVGPVLDSWSWG
jgi:hypothetical protein